MSTELDFSKPCAYLCRVSKTRLDVLLVERKLAETRQRSRALILAGEVTVNGRVVDKVGTLVPEDAQITVRAPLKYVSRGGIKLEGALDSFGIDVHGRVCADIGASTGGFTDCLLQRGAVRVYAIDVGYGQLAWKLRTDPRVKTLDRVNIRFLDRLDEPVSLASVDVSFISLTLVLPVVKKLLGPSGQVVALVKPQFEAGREQVGKGGIVRDPLVHRQVVERILEHAIQDGWHICGLTRSPIAGADGNVEFFVWLSADSTLDAIPPGQMIQGVF